jgi:hypothetical protein
VGPVATPNCGCLDGGEHHGCRNGYASNGPSVVQATQRGVRIMVRGPIGTDGSIASGLHDVLRRSLAGDAAAAAETETDEDEDDAGQELAE